MHYASARTTRQAAALLLLCLAACAPGLVAAEGGLTVFRAANDQYLEIRDAGKPVLRYNFRTVPVPKTAKGKYAVARGDYVHPIWGPAGEVLTKDYSPDHPHHRGLYWAWPEVTYKGQTRDLHALQGVFARPVKIVLAETFEDAAVIIAASKWLWGDKEHIVDEMASISASKLDADGGRVIDLAYTFTARVDGVTLARRGQKAYGGLNLRMSARTGQQILPHTDPADTLAAKKPRRAWAQLVGTPAGGKGPVALAILQHAGNPHYPGDWVTYPNLNWLQPTFPAKGVKHPLTKGKPLVLKFRLYIQAGKVSDKKLDTLWRDLNRLPAKEKAKKGS
jgi:hypothetical protein